jgi:hypothetical protein
VADVDPGICSPGAVALRDDALLYPGALAKFGKVVVGIAILSPVSVQDTEVQCSGEIRRQFTHESRINLSGGRGGDVCPD